jgi:hypothetical protein
MDALLEEAHSTLDIILLEYGGRITINLQEWKCGLMGCIRLLILSVNNLDNIRIIWMQSDSILPPLLSGYSWVNWLSQGRVPKWENEMSWNEQPESLKMFDQVNSSKLTTLQLSLPFTEDAYHPCSNLTLHWHLTKTLPSGRRESQPLTSP